MKGNTKALKPYILPHCQISTIHMIPYSLYKYKRIFYKCLGKNWELYRNIAFILIFAFSFSYWFYKKDKSEAFSVGIGISILWFFGIEDILYFWLQETGVPQFLPWLNNSLVVGNLSHIIGFTDVTNISLYLIAIVGLVLTFITTKILVRKF